MSSRKLIVVHQSYCRLLSWLRRSLKGCLVNKVNFKRVLCNFLQSYDPGAGNTILDYQVVIKELKPEDRILPYAEAGNYSITGFEMTLTRNVAK